MLDTTTLGEPFEVEEKMGLSPTYLKYSIDDNFPEAWARTVQLIRENPNNPYVLFEQGIVPFIRKLPDAFAIDTVTQESVDELFKMDNSDYIPEALKEFRAWTSARSVTANVQADALKNILETAWVLSSNHDFKYVYDVSNRYIGLRGSSHVSSLHSALSFFAPRASVEDIEEVRRRTEFFKSEDELRTVIIENLVSKKESLNGDKMIMYYTEYLKDSEVFIDALNDSVASQVYWHPFNTMSGIFLDAFVFGYAEGSTALTNFKEGIYNVTRRFPKQADAFLRDIAKLLSRIPGITLPPDLPTVDKDEELEDPFMIGKNNLVKLTKQDYTTKVALLAQEDTLDSRVCSGDRISKADKERYMAKLRKNTDMPSHTKSGLLRGLYRHLSPAEKREICDLVLRKILESDPLAITLKVFAPIYLGSGGEVFRSVLFKLMHSDSAMDCVVRSMQENGPLDAAFAIRILADYCLIDGKVDKERLKRVSRKFLVYPKNPGSVADTQDLLISFAIKVFAFLQNIPNNRENHEMFAYELANDPKNLKLKGAKQHTETVSTLFAKPTVEKAYAKMSELKEAGKAFGSEVQKTKIPDSFSRDQALKELKENTSRPLLERSKIDSSEISDDSMEVFLIPDEGSTHERKRFKVIIALSCLSEEGFSYEYATVNFNNGKPSTNVPPKITEIVENIAIYAAYIYYVRDKDKHSSEEVEKVSTGEGTTNKDIENEIQVVRGRVEAPLKVDIRDSEDNADKVSKGKNTKLVGENIAAVKKLLRKEDEGIDFSKVMIFTRIKYMDGYIYEKLDEARVRQLYEEDRLRDDDYFVLSTAPHTCATGFYENKNSKYIDDDGKRKKSSISQILPRKATGFSKTAYDYYLLNGFEALSGFEPYNTTLGIVVDAEYNEKEIATFKSEDGKEISGLEIISAVRRDINAELVRKVRDPKWMDSWAAQQEKVLKEEIEEIEHSNFEEEVKNAEVKKRREKIRSLNGIIETAAQRTSVIVQDGNGGRKVSARLTLHEEFQSERLFNQGTYIPVKELAA